MNTILFARSPPAGFFLCPKSSNKQGEELMPQDFSVVLPKLWRKRQAWDAERTKCPPYRGEER